MTSCDPFWTRAFSWRAASMAVVAAGAGMALLCGCDLSYYPPGVPVYEGDCCDPYYAYDGWYDYGFGADAYYEDPYYYDDGYYYEDDYYGYYDDYYDDAFDFDFDFWYGD